jgi:hypothetical protein
MTARADLPKAILISDAGSEEANGVYRATTREYCDAPVYEHVERGAELKLTREPHKNPKTGAIKHGWLLGQNKTPLYGAPTEALAVPSTGWKKFSGNPPVPSVKILDQVNDVYYEKADECRSQGDSAAEQEDWQAARDAYANGVEALKRSGETSGDAFHSRASALLGRRATANMKLQDVKLALRDAVAALEFVRSSASAEAVAIQAAKELGCKDDAMVQKFMEQIGHGKILDPDAPLMLRCVERWSLDCVDTLAAEGLEAPIPVVSHLPADRYLDGLTEQQCTELLRKYLPEALPKPDGGSAILSDARQCLELMKKWEEVLKGDNFQTAKTDLWDTQGLSYVSRMSKTRKLLCTSLREVLLERGYAEGQPGMNRCIEQMQFWWSTDKACARKALDLEEMADVSLADLAE